jgi:hypothetical protein
MQENTLVRRTLWSGGTSTTPHGMCMCVWKGKKRTFAHTHRPLVHVEEHLREWIEEGFGILPRREKKIFQRSKFEHTHPRGLGGSRWTTVGQYCVIKRGDGAREELTSTTITRTAHRLNLLLDFAATIFLVPKSYFPSRTHSYLAMHARSVGLLEWECRRRHLPCTGCVYLFISSSRKKATRRASVSRFAVVLLDGFCEAQKNQKFILCP